MGTGPEGPGNRGSWGQALGPWGQALGAMGTGLGDNGDSAQRGTLGTGLEALGTGPVRRVTALRTTTIVENRGRITSVFYNLQ